MCCQSMLLFLLASICLSCNNIYSTKFNLDFEYAVEKNQPTQWNMPDKSYHGYVAELTPFEKKHGNYSLHMNQIDSTKSSWAIFSQNLPASMVRGKTVEFSGWIKTDQLTEGFANLYLEEYKNANFNNFPVDRLNRGVRNSSGWTKIVIKKYFDDNASFVLFGGILKGKGDAWFDNFDITIDGVSLHDTIVSTPKVRLTQEDKHELQKYIYPIQTIEVDEVCTEDLNVLKDLIGTSSVVALGENSHGSSEIYKMKERFIRYMAQYLGFDIFSIEADMPNAYQLNTYIQQGKGSPEQLINNMGMWIWSTKEMLSLVNWMREYNDSTSKITYTGFDMQNINSSIEYLKIAFNGNEQLYQLLNSIQDTVKKVLNYSSIGSPQIDTEMAADIRSNLAIIKDCINTLSYDNKTKEWLHQNVTLIYQFLGQGSVVWRDQCMADNILWIKQQNPTSRIVIWAHNGHIEKKSSMMGDFLDDNLKSAYTNFGFTFYDGTYTGIHRDSKDFIQKAQQAYPGTLEYLLEKLDEPIFILDLKKMREDEASVLTWIDDLRFRHVGALKLENEFTDKDISKKFDYLVFIKHTSPSQLFFK